LLNTSNKFVKKEDYRKIRTGYVTRDNLLNYIQLSIIKLYKIYNKIKFHKEFLKLNMYALMLEYIF